MDECVPAEKWLRQTNNNKLNTTRATRSPVQVTSQAQLKTSGPALPWSPPSLSSSLSAGQDPDDPRDLHEAKMEDGG